MQCDPRLSLHSTRIPEGIVKSNYSTFPRWSSPNTCRWRQWSVLLQTTASTNLRFASSRTFSPVCTMSMNESHGDGINTLTANLLSVSLSKTSVSKIPLNTNSVDWCVLRQMRHTFRSCKARIRSSTVFSMTNRWTKTFFCCPRRWTRSKA